MSYPETYQRSESLQLYRGLIAKIMIYLGLAFKQILLDENGRAITWAINKKSLGHYIWRHNRCRDTGRKYTKNMKKFYSISHSFFNKKYKFYKNFKEETFFQISQRNIFTEQVLKYQDFIELVKQQAPLRGCFYKIKKEDRTLGYLLGTMHSGNELLINLNPKINKALVKSKFIAGEANFESVFQPKKASEKTNKKNSTQKIKLIQKNLNYLIDKQLGFSYSNGIEGCIYKKVKLLKDPLKEFVALESEDENKENDKVHNQVYGPCDNNVIDRDMILNDSQECYQMYRDILNGTEVIETLKDTVVDTREACNINVRNLAMVNRSISYLEKERTFVAIGFFHLLGEQGMIRLYEGQGYTLERVT